MKAVMFIIFMLLAATVSAASLNVKTAVESFFTDETPDVVIGDGQNVDDQLASFAFANEFGLKNFTLKGKMTNKPLIIIGGPCANPLWAEFAGDTCDNWQYSEGKAVIMAHQTTTGKTVVLIAGTTGKDTRAAAKYVLTTFSDAKFLETRVVIDTANLPLANDKLKIYKTETNLAEGESSAQGTVIIEIPNDSSGGTEDLAEGLEEHLKKSFPFANVAIYRQADVDMAFIQGKILFVFKDPILISIEEDAPADHVVIAAGGAFWVAGQGYDISPTQTHNQLGHEDLQFE